MKSLQLIAAAAALLLAGAASAHGYHHGGGYERGGVALSIGVPYAAPIYVSPPPVYYPQVQRAVVAEAPVYYYGRPAPAMAGQVVTYEQVIARNAAPVYVEQPLYVRHHRHIQHTAHHHGHHGKPPAKLHAKHDRG